MKNLFSLFVTILVTTSLWAYDFQSGELYYNITNDTVAPYTVADNVEFVANFQEVVVEPEEPTYEIYEQAITNLVIDFNNLILTGGPSEEFLVTVTLGLGEYDMTEGIFQLLPESEISVQGYDATFVEGWAYVDGIANTAEAVVRCLWYDMAIEFHLSMAPMEATVVVVENATVEVEKFIIFGDEYDYSLKMTGTWYNEADETTYPVSVEVPVYYPEATEPSEINSIVTVGGWEDDDPWLGFGEGTLTITTIDGVVTATGVVTNPGAGIAFDITISGNASKKYTVSIDAINGDVTGSGIYEYGVTATLKAIANTGYHFVKWSDEVVDNPRTITVVSDITLTAEFAPNNYTISTLSSDIERGTISGDVTTTYLDHVTITATASYGYHFSHWDDYNYDNPRTVQVTENKTYTAYFAKNTYSITKNCNSEQGYIDGISSAKYLDQVTLTAIPNYGYHFTQWSDGNTENPRSLILTQDTTFTAEFAPNQYTITTTSSQPDRGTTQGNAMVNYLEYVTIFAEANYGYYFTQWNDGNTDNPRSVQVTEDKTYTAYFGKNTYSVTKNYDSTMGTVEGTTSAQYKDQITLTASPIFGYEFVRWSDGNTANPRTFTLTQDTAFTAEFAQSFSGKCGNQLYWSYDPSNNSISISGRGKMYDYTATTQPWLLFQKNIMEVITSNKTLSIGKSAFEGCIRLAKLTLGAEVEEIGENAFAGCTRLYDIYSYPIYPPFAEVSSFANYEVCLYIPCESERNYKFDLIWKKFTIIECIGAESDNVYDESVKVEPSTNSVTITWPTDENADTYSIEIKRGDVVFCTLTFSKDGMLTNIAFAPSRSGNHPVTYAASTGNGLRFTVTSLEESTTYAYDITTKDVDDNTISTYSGEFTTKGNVTTDMDNIQSPASTCQKIFRNGQLIILRDGKTYTTMGAEM